MSRTALYNPEIHYKYTAFWTREDGFYCEPEGVSHAGKTFHTLRKQMDAEMLFAQLSTRYKCAQCLTSPV